MTSSLRTVCIVLGIVLGFIVLVGIVVVWVTTFMRNRIDPHLSPFESVHRFLKWEWLDAYVAPTSDSTKEKQVQLSIEPSMSDRTQQKGSSRPILLPCDLTNGGLFLLLIRIPGSPPTRVILDTASSFLLLADLDKCQKCSASIYGGAKSDASQEHLSRVVVHFGSQKDDVQFQVRDVQLVNEDIVPNISVGMVQARETRIAKNTHTFNIMGIGNIMDPKSIIRRLLQYYHQPLAFGFYFGENLKAGSFVLGHAIRQTQPVLSLPLHIHESKPYYLLQIHNIRLISNQQQTLDFPESRFPIPETLADTGANFLALPDFLEPYFDEYSIDSMEFQFDTVDGIKTLFVPHSRLYNSRGRKVFYFNSNLCVIGTLIMSLFSFVEFDFVQNPTLRFWI